MQDEWNQRLQEWAREVASFRAELRSSRAWADIRFFRNCLLHGQKEERERATAITYPGQAMAAVMALVGYIPQLLQGESSGRACACCPSGLPTWFVCSSQWFNHLVVMKGWSFSVITDRIVAFRKKKGQPR